MVFLFNGFVRFPFLNYKIKAHYDMQYLNKTDNAGKTRVINKLLSTNKLSISRESSSLTRN